MAHSIPDGNVVSRAFKMEPAVLRGTLIGLTAIIAGVAGKQIDTGWVDNILFIYTLVSPIVAGITIRSAVTPAGRVADIIKRMKAETAGYQGLPPKIGEASE